MTVDQFVEWLRKNTKPTDEIEYIDIHGGPVEYLKTHRTESPDGTASVFVMGW